MCGITGYARASDSPAAFEPIGVLMRMTAALAHRGPDGDGLLLRGRVALGHRRLAVLDPAHGRQPVCLDAPPLSLVHNGEIYNFQELNGELAGLGRAAKTGCDAETILNAYAAWGDRCVERFNGMFAFVIHDVERRRLFAARDRLGEKPFYYVHRDGLFAFASEPRALLQHPDVDGALDMQSAAAFLVREHVPAPRSIWQGMRVLPPGHALSFDLDRGALAIEPWWRLPLPGPGPAPTERECIDRVRHLLRSAIEKRLVSDVPLGVFLSGGLDSSAIAGIMARDLGRRDLETFSIGFDDLGFDEAPWARRVADHLGTAHHEFRIGPRDALETLAQLAGHLDEPLADASILPTSLLARFARRRVTVALGGDGGDELFAGYQTFAALRAVRHYDRFVPRAAHDRLLSAVTRRVPAGDGYFTAAFKLRQFLRGAHQPPARRLWRWLGAVAPQELPGLLTPDAMAAIDLDALDGRLDDLHTAHAGCDDVTRDLRVYAQTYLPDGILAKLDRATMRVGLEARCPFLDHDLVEFAASIPSRLKVRRGRLKHVLRESVRDLLPRDLADRRKHGFAPPIAAWLRGPLRDLLQDTLSERRLREGGFLRPDAVSRLVGEHLAGTHDHRKPLFALFMLEQWRHHWIERHCPDRSGAASGRTLALAAPRPIRSAASP